MTSTFIPFPRDFIAGACNSAFKVEGDQEGRGGDIWDRFSLRPGAIKDGTTPAKACGLFTRYPQDIKLMKALGLGRFRLGIHWARVQEDGTGPVNGPGLDFYDRFVDELLEHDIVPWGTLSALELPQWLQDRGGWLNRDTASFF